MHSPPLAGMILARAPRRLARVAAAALTYFTDQLVLAVEPDLYWFFEVHGSEDGYSTEMTMRGCTVVDDGEVWLSICQDEHEVWLTMAHELGHVAGMNEDQAMEYEGQAHVTESYYRWAATNLGAA